MRLDVEKFVSGLHDYLAKAFAPIVERLNALESRKPEKGEKGDPGQGEPGAPGKDGKDGTSITLEDVLPILKSMQAEWALDFERRAQALFQKAVDEIPKPKDGKDGVDGIGWENMTVEHDGKRTVTLKWANGEKEVSAPVVFPCNIDAGFYKDGTQYEQGDGVTFGGSYWIAQKATSAKPEVGSEDWRLAVRKGRDGKRD
jgi:hypothetical protein